MSHPTKKSSLRLGLLVIIGVIGVAAYRVGFDSQNRPQRVAAQGESTCDSLIQEALQLSSNFCLELGRNEACYGFNNVSVVLSNPEAQFAQRGDIVPVTDIETLITRPIDPATGEWGIVMMNLDADLPDTSGETVRLLLFGGAEITPQTPDALVENRPNVQVTNTNDNNLNLRSGPGQEFPVVDIFDIGDTLPFYGRNEAGDWLRSSRGWLYVPLATVEGNISTLQLIEAAEDAYVAPMQSFALQMDEAANCTAAPSGLLVQTPSGQTANLMVNNVEIRIGSTAYIRTRNNNSELVIANVQGNVQVISNDFDQPVPEGAQVGVEFNDDDAGQPGGLEPIDGNLTNLDTRFLGELPQSVNIPKPWTPEVEITFAAAPSSIPAGACTTLNWQVSNAAQILLAGSPVEAFGTQVECPVSTTTYTLVGIASDGTETAQQITVTVTPNALATTPPPNPTSVAPTVVIDFFSASPASIIQLGECVTLAWSVSGDVAGVFLDDGFGETPQSLSGSLSACPEVAPTTYTLRAQDSGGMNVYASLTVDVEVQSTPAATPG